MADRDRGSGGSAHRPALPPPDAECQTGHETLSGGSQRLDRRGLLSGLVRPAQPQRRAGPLLGDHGRDLALRPLCRFHALRAHEPPKRLRPVALPHAAGLSALFAGAGAVVPDDDHARDALFGGGLHHRSDAGLHAPYQHLPRTVPLPLGADRAGEGLLLRYSRRLPAGRLDRAGALPLFPRIHRQEPRTAHQARRADAQRAVDPALHRHRPFLHRHAAAPDPALRPTGRPPRFFGNR